MHIRHKHNINNNFINQSMVPCECYAINNINGTMWYACLFPQNTPHYVAMLIKK